MRFRANTTLCEFVGGGADGTNMPVSDSVEFGRVEVQDSEHSPTRTEYYRRSEVNRTQFFWQPKDPSLAYVVSRLEGGEA